MAKAYQYDAQGYFVGITNDYGGPLPNNSTRTAPDIQDGHIPRWTGNAWEQIEDHKGKEGYVNDKPFTVKEYGPLPEGWSEVPPPPTLEEAVTAKLAEVMGRYSSAFAPVEAVYPAAEREGWPVQEAEARAHVADPAADTPVLSALVQLRARGETVAELAQKVLANAAQWRNVYAYLTGQQQRMYAEVTALAAQDGITGADIAAYPVQYAMPEGL
jgi:hypothetical protein